MTSDEPVLRRPVDCADCGASAPLADWLDDERCPRCGEPHVVPVLPAARRAVETGDFVGATIAEVAEAFGLDAADTTDLLLALGCSAAAALDVSRVVVDGRPRSEWRRWIGETRERERRQVAAAEEVLAEHGVAIDYPSE